MSTPAAGWYPDPNDSSQQRWWNGSGWDDRTQPAAGAPAATAVMGGGGGGGAPVGQSVAGGSPGASSDPRYAHDKFLVRQFVRLGVNKYEVRVGLGDGPKLEGGDLVAFVQQKRLALKEKITFFGDESKTQPILELQAQKAMDFKGRHNLTDVTTGQVVGQLNRKFGASAFVSSTWNILDAEGSEILTITETSKFFALARRYGPDGLAMFPYDMTLTAGPDSGKLGAMPGTVIGHHKRRWGLKDVYDLDVTGDPQRLIDRRLIVAAAIALDSLEGR